MLQQDNRMELYIHFENTLIDSISSIKEKKSDISFEDILITYFECIIIGFCEKSEIIDNFDSSNNDRYTRGVSFLNGQFDRDLNTNIFFLNKFDSGILQILSEDFFNSFDYMYLNHSIDMSDIGILFEEFFNKEIDIEGRKLNNTRSRKDTGMYFTNDNIVRFIVHNLIDKNRKNISENKVSFIDPAMGAGIFIFILMEEVELLDKNFDPKSFLTNCVFGIDKNPLLIDIFRVCLWAKYYRYNIQFRDICANFRVEDSLLLELSENTSGAKSWNAVFPDVFNRGGFDCILGNPPWGRIKANIREYNILHNNLNMNYQGDLLKLKMKKDTKFFKKWDEYRKYISSYSEILKNSNNYSHQKYEIDGSSTGGDADLYKYFLEQCFNILKKGGTLGYIIPASFYLSESATGLRHLYLENGTIDYLINFENKKHIFPIHPSFKFILLLYEKTGDAGEIKHAAFNLTDPTELLPNKFEQINFVSYTRTFLNLCSNNYWTVPECSTYLEQEILRKLYFAFPTLSEKRDDLWSVSFNRELDMTLDSDKFVDTSTGIGNNEEYLPVYEGRMVHQYNSSRKKYIMGNGRTAVWQINKDAVKSEIVPHYYVNEEARKSNKYKIYRAGFCDVTGQKNVRTILASIIPDNAVCGNKVPTCTFSPKNSIAYHLYWVAVANSFVIDWIIRKKMTITLNFFHWNQIPFPRIDLASKTAKKIILNSAALIEKINGFNLSDYLKEELSPEYMEEYYKLKDKEIYELRLEVDCMVAELFRLSVQDLAIIMLGFPSLDSKQIGIAGDRKYQTSRKGIYVTRDYLLYYYMKKLSIKTNISIINLYKEIGLDIEQYTGGIQSLDDRISYYDNNKVLPYND